MRKLLLTFILFVFVLSYSFTTDYIEAPFVPVSPEVMAQGGSFSAVAKGYNSLFYNPAGFRMGGTFTLPSMSMWMYANPTAVLGIVNTISSMDGTSNSEALGSLMDNINDQVSSGGLGIGMSIGAGLVVKGLGIGGALIIDSMLYGGRNVMDASGDLTATLGFVGGYALDFDLGGLGLAVGADVRPMYRVHAAIDNALAAELLSKLMTGGDAFSLLNQSGTYSGLGVGIDLGAIVTLGALKFSFSVRDLFDTQFAYTHATFADTLTAIGAGTSVVGDPLPEGDSYRIPMNVSTGAAFHPDLGALSFLIDPTVHVDLQDAIGVFKYGRSPWTLLHIGSEVRVLRFIKVRAGFNQGYISIGGGIHLLFLDLNIAAFTRELGKHILDQPNSGITLELAIRI